MDIYLRHQRIWRLFYGLLAPWICRKFNLSHEDLHVDGPVILIPNHVCAWDPLLVAMSLKNKQCYYVASEHLFRLGFVTRLLDYLVAPIPRRKASAGTDTVKACLRHLRAGHSICLFAEGEQCWAGRNIPIFPSTGKLVKASGATLVTFKIEGGYLSLPRWGKGVRRGEVRVHPVNIYPPETLKTMTAKQIVEVIDRDIAEDAWERQRLSPVAYRGKRRAEGMEKALYLCPRCRRLDTLRTRDDRIFCDCGLDLRYTETGFFSPAEPFEDLAVWDDWQRESLRRRDFVRPTEAKDLYFHDEGMCLSQVSIDHGEVPLGEGELRQYADRLVCAGQDFPLGEIHNMAMVQSHLLLLTDSQGNYYQIRSEKGANLRKYLELWSTR